MRGRSMLKALALAMVLFGFSGAARAQDWSDYLHWPYTPPQVPGNGFEYGSLYDGFYRYPREQRIVPQIQGPYSRNFYGGKRVKGIRRWVGGGETSHKKTFYEGNHFALDVFR